MGESYSFEIVERAEQLYCVEGHTFDAVASLMGIGVSTLKRWSADYGWQDKREQIRQAMSSIRTNTILLRAKLIQNCMQTLNAQDAFAVSAIESLAQRAAAQGTAATAQAPDQLREIKTDEDAVSALEEALEIKLNGMLANPGSISLSAIKEIKTVQDFLRDMRAQIAPKDDQADTRKKGLSAESADDLRRQILGIKG